MENNKHILFISYDGLTDNLGQSQIIPYMNGLAKAGFRIHIISVDKPIVFKNREDTVRNSLDTRISWYPIPYHKTPPLLSTLWDLYKVKRKTKEIISKHPISLLHVRSYPPMNLALDLKEKYTLQVLFDMRGFYADERIEGGIWNKKNPIHRYFYKRIKRAEKVYFNSSDQIISLTQNGKEHISERFGINSEKITVIPCCADFDHFDALRPYPSSSLRNIVYLGSLGTWYLIHDLLTLFKRIHDQYPDSILNILSGDDFSEVKDMARKMQLPERSLRFRSVERSELPDVLSGMDLSIFLIKESFSKKASSPTKLAELLAAGIPVICNTGVGDLAQIADRYTAIKALPLEELNTFPVRDTIQTLLEVPPEQIRKQAISEFSVQMALQRYKTVYNGLLKIDI